jgi:O-antigen/teichoic acid export membrane protein
MAHDHQPMPSPVPQDNTGRSRLAQNVIFSWAGQMVYVIAGFVLPRLIDNELGQERLGIWDFGWSLVSYFGLVSGGVMSAISRYVAKYRATNDVDRVNETVSTGLTLYMITGSVVAGLTILVTMYLPKLFGQGLGEHMIEAQWVIGLLGLSLTIQFVFAVFNGIITGCQRWGTHSLIGAGIHALTACTIAVAVLTGGGVALMAFITLVYEALAGVLRVMASYRFCPGLRLSPRLVSRTHMQKMIGFGAKTMLSSVAAIILYQTSNIFIVYYLGPATLALYARPAALVRHAKLFVYKFAHVFAPTASAVHETKDPNAVARLLIQGSKYGLYFALPAVLAMTIMGSPLLRVWMGNDYDQGIVLAILAIGHLASFSQESTYHVLLGMGRHGLPSFVMLIAAICTAPLSLLALGVMDWGLVGAALAVVVPLTMVNATLIPAMACRIVGIPFTTFVMKSVSGPTMAVIPFVICLIAARLAWPEHPGTMLLVGFGSSGVVLGIVYWQWVLPEKIKEAVLSRLAKSFRARNKKELPRTT